MLICDYLQWQEQCFRSVCLLAQTVGVLQRSFTNCSPQSPLIVQSSTWTNRSSKLFLGWCLIYRSAAVAAARTLRLLSSSGSLLSRSHFSRTVTDMRSSSAVPVLLVLCVGLSGCKPSSSCPSGQFALKNQCVLCHPTCSECDGHELFECTTCGVCEYMIDLWALKRSINMK